MFTTKAPARPAFAGAQPAAAPLQQQHDDPSIYAARPAAPAASGGGEAPAPVPAGSTVIELARPLPTHRGEIRQVTLRPITVADYIDIGQVEVVRVVALDPDTRHPSQFERVAQAITAQTPAASGAWRTGDAKFTMQATAASGWLQMNDGTIGDATSGAGYASAAAEALFTLLFNNVADADCPILDSGGGATTRAAQTDAPTAWAAHCRMTLPKVLGRALAGAGAGSGLTSRALGSKAGAETETPTIAKTASHGHDTTIQAPGGGAVVGTYTPATGNGTGVQTALVGSGNPLDIVQPTSFWNVEIKL